MSDSPAERHIAARKRLAANLGVQGTVEATRSRSAGLDPEIAANFRSNLTQMEVSTLDAIYKATKAAGGSPAPVSSHALAVTLHTTPQMLQSS